MTPDTMGFLRQRILNLLSDGEWVSRRELVDGCYAGSKGGGPLDPDNVIRVTIFELRALGFPIERATAYRMLPR